MARVTPLLSTFNAGEWSPELWARVDLGKFRNACARLENFLPLTQGPAMRRSGTRYVGATKGDGMARLLRFEFNVEQAYMLEFGDSYVRFFKDRGRIVAADTVAAIANGAFDASLTGWTASSASWDAGTQSALFAGSGTLTQSVACTSGVEHVIRFRVRGTAGTDKLALRVGTTSGGTEVLADVVFDVGWHCFAFTPGATPAFVQFRQSAGAPKLDDVALVDGGPIEIGSPYGQAILFDLASAQSADTMYVAAGSVPPYKLTRTGHAKWSLTELVFTAKPSEWTGTTWPRAVTFHEERLWWGGTPDRPQTVWASRTGNFLDMTIGTLADDGLKYTISDDRVNAIRWMSAGKVLAIGTTGGEFSVSASTLNEAITPDNVQVRRETTIGSGAAQPLRIGNAVLFVQRAGRKIHEFAYNWEGDSYAAPEMTLLARHLTRPGIKQLAFQQEPQAIIWAALEDGGLAGLTYMRDQDVTAWHRHLLGGSGVKVLSVAVIPGIGQDELWLVVERQIGGAARRYVEFMEYEYRPLNVDDKWSAFFVDSGLSLNAPVPATLTPGTGATAQGTTGVAFTSGAATFAPGDVGREIRQRYLKDGRSRTARALVTGYASATSVTATILAPFPSLSPIAAGAWYLTVDAVTGLDHLEGETVQLLVDGATHPEKVVAGGIVPLDRRGAVVQAGLGYVSTLETLDLDAGAMAGTAVGKAQRINKAAVRFNDALGAKLGAGGALDQIPFRSGADPMDESPPLFTGVKVLAFPKGWSGQGAGSGGGSGARVRVVQDLPLPCTVAAVAPVVTTNEG